jgi:hypothetical protein
VSYSSLSWYKESGEPTLNEISNEVMMIVRGSKDPFVRISMNPDITFAPTKNALRIGAIFIFVIGIILIALPVCYVLYNEESDEIRRHERIDLYKI